MMERRNSLPRERIYRSCTTWEIHNFFSGVLGLNKEIQSPEFVTNFHVPISWRLCVIGKGTFGKGYESRISLRRTSTFSDPPSLVTKVKFELIDSNGNVHGIRPCYLEFSKYISVIVIINSVYGKITGYDMNTFTNSSPIKVKCEMYLPIKLLFQMSDIDKDLKVLSNDLNVLNKAPNLADLYVIAKDKKFSVHRAIVKSRSPYVARILDENPGQREIDLTEKGSAEDIEGLIVYWYSGDLDKFPRCLASNMLSFIEKMEQSELKPYAEAECSSMSTTFKKLNKSITWVIIDEVFCFKLKEIQKHEFTKYTIKDHPWQLQFYAKGHIGDTDHISLCVEEVGEIICAQPVYLEIFLKIRGVEHGCKRTISWLHSPGKYEFPNFMSHNEFGKLWQNIFLNDELQIGCRIEYSTGSVENHPQTFSDAVSVDSTPPHPYTALANNLKHLLETEDTSDISLKINDRIFKVHIAILAARSKYFAVLLMNREMNGEKTDEIELKDVEPEDLDMILKYMYHAEKIQLNLELAVRLYPVVRKYQISSLEIQYSEFLQNHMTVENAITFIELAHKFEDSSLKRNAREIIHANWDQISKSERWRKLQNDNSELASEIMPRIRS